MSIGIFHDHCTSEGRVHGCRNHSRDVIVSRKVTMQMEKPCYSLHLLVDIKLLAFGRDNLQTGTGNVLAVWGPLTGGPNVACRF